MIGGPAFGGWKDRGAGDTVQTFTISTTAPTELCGQIHDRIAGEMGNLARKRAADADELRSIVLRPYPGERTRTYTVDLRVGNVRNNDPMLLDPVALAA